MKRLDEHPSSPGTAGLHALIVRFSAVSAWLVALTLTAVATVGSDRVILLQAVAAGACGLTFTAQLLTGRVNALVSMLVGILLVVSTMPLIQGPEWALAASMAVVAMATVSSLFVHRFQAAFLSLGALAMLLVPRLWADDFASSLTVGVIMAVSFLIGASGFMLIRDRTIASDQQYRWLFERAPVGLVEQDWTEALRFVDSLRPRDAEHLTHILSQDIALLARIVSRIEVVKANDAVGEILRVPLKRFLGKLSVQRVSPANQHVWVRQVVGMWLGRPFDAVEYESTDYHGNPGLWLEVRTISVGSPNPQRVVLAVTDVTRSRRESEELADLVREKDEFIATVSHELRTPLTAVVGLANEVLDGPDLTPHDRRELLELVVAQANEISHLVEDLLVGARAEIGTITVTPEPLDLVAEARTVTSTLDQPIPVEPAAGCGMALGDPVRIRQIIRNLAVNATRYGGPSRRIVIRPGEGGTIRLEVRDNGLPLDGEDRERIFEPYTRAHDRPGVTVSVGLGLAVSRRLARLMGGDLTYDHDGWEAIFCLEAPLADAGSEAAGPPIIRAG